MIIVATARTVFASDEDDNDYFIFDWDSLTQRDNNAINATSVLTIEIFTERSALLDLETRNAETEKNQRDKDILFIDLQQETDSKPLVNDLFDEPSQYISSKHVENELSNENTIVIVMAIIFIAFTSYGGTMLYRKNKRRRV